MKNYRKFLFENNKNTYIELVQWLSTKNISDKVNSDDDSSRYYVEKETTSTKTIIIYGETPTDRVLLKNELLDFLEKNELSFTHNTKIGGTHGRTEISEDTSGIGKKLHIQYKYSSNSIDIQELLVGALVLIGESHNGTLTLVECDNILKKCKGTITKIKGIKDPEKFSELTKGNYLDLAPSISSCNSILEIIKADGQIIKDAYWTGQSWHKDIRFLNPPIGNIKDYNSSDIIFKTNGINGDVFYGFSLKKKGKRTDADPTLINKTITGKRSFLKGIIPDSEIKKIEDSKIEFFKLVLKGEFKNLNQSVINKMKENEIKDYIKQLNNEDVAKYLKSSDSIFFKTIGETLPKYATDFIKGFLELIFRTKLSNTLESTDFKFNLNTGIGRVNKNYVTTEPAENKDLATTIEVLTDVFNSKLTIEKTKGKLQAWDKGTKAAKIFYTIYSNALPILDIEIRYKGSFTAEPQFQATATPNFKNLFKN